MDSSMPAKVTNVIKGSLGYRAGLKPGDVIVAINGTEIIDYLDYMYAAASERVEIKCKDRTVLIANEDYEPLGLEFETLLIDKPKHCCNKCIFCFIDQLPPHMRSSCYFKDDDFRLSFLQGNYVSLTNMTEQDVERIIAYNIPRINISIHTTNPDLRVKMLHNKNAGKALDILWSFADNGLNMNGQIVLCPGWNDGAELDRTLEDLSKITHSMESVSIVPVGMTKYRDGLEKLSLFTPETAAAVIRQVERWQTRFREEAGSNFVFLGDEFYLMAGMPLPEYEEYEGFPQIENGVGLCASLIYEFREALRETKDRRPSRRKTIATGRLVYPTLKKLVKQLDGDMIQVIPITNNFFGKDITVTGLITGGDLIEQLKNIPLGEELMISSSMLRHGEAVFLDDKTVEEVEHALNVSVRPVENDGYRLLEALLDKGGKITYETDCGCCWAP